MPQIPRERTLDSTAAFLREGYAFIGRRCERMNTDAFRTRLMLRNVLCMRGYEAAELFYGTDIFTRRRGALPPSTLRLLQDKGSVMALDGAAHHHRKRLFLDLLESPEAIARACALMRDRWLAALPQWERKGTVTLFDALAPVLTETMTLWVGLPIDGRTPKLTTEVTAMVEGVAKLGPGLARALYLRQRSELWLRKLVRDMRSGTLRLAPSAPARLVAEHRDENGELLSETDAGVEIINLIRPSVAVRRFLVFCAMALDDNPEWREQLSQSDDGLEAFVEEVRRFYPFIPMMGGVALKPFRFMETAFDEGQWVLLDLYGTDRHPGEFAQPDHFNPARALSYRRDGYRFIPQGAGPVATSHRCPGEALTVAMMMEAVRILCRSMRYSVPRQDLSIDLGHIPAMAASGFRIDEVSAR